MAHEIYAIDGPGIREHSTPRAHEVYYFEGMSGKLAAEEKGTIHEVSDGWFCFEELLAVGCAELTKLGFTVEQTMTALAEMRGLRLEDEDEWQRFQAAEPRGSGS